MAETLKTPQNPQLNIPVVSIRYFYVCTIGKLSSNIFSVNYFDIQTTYGHPTMKRCIEFSNEKFPNLTEVALISISEISAEDWKIFISEK